MFTMTAKIAADRSLGGPARAARIATTYMERCREQLFDWSRSNPEDEGNATEFQAQVTKQYLERDPKCYEDAKGKVDAPSRKASRPESHSAGGNRGTEHCLTNAVGNCTNKCCKFQHDCPFCFSSNRSCPNNAGCYLEWHLGSMRKPKCIIPASQSRALYANDQRRGARSRSRNRNRRESPRR